MRANSLRNGTGIFLEEQGIYTEEQGIYTEEQGISAPTTADDGRAANEPEFMRNMSSEFGRIH